MSDGAPRNIHTVSAGYVRRFTGPRNTVTVHHRQRGVFDQGPRGVGRQINYWGSPKLASELERIFGRMESDSLRLLRRLPEHWPLTDKDDRAALAQLVAIHIVRMPAFGGELRLLGERASREVLAENGPKYGLDDEQIAIVAENLRGHRVHADTLLRQVPRIASALCSMHWSVVEFGDDWLISCDQPVVLFPLVPTPVSPASALPRLGFMKTVEGFFTLDPRRVLLLTWLDGPDGLWLTGNHEHACSINCALKAQALEEWFCRPGSSPPFLAPPLLTERVAPLSPSLLPGYTAQGAAVSQRRQAADRIMDKLLAEMKPGQMRWARVSLTHPARLARGR